MYNILTLNKIAAIGTSRLGDNYKYGDDVQNPDAVLVRSAAMHDMEFADNLLAIARAGAGTNNIPKDKCSEQGIVVFNTPGANATLLRSLLSQDFLFQIVRLLRVMNGQRLSRATVQLSVRWLKRARVSSSAPKSRVRPSVLSVLEQSVFLLQMQLLLSV